MKHILIVDDEKDTRDFMARALEENYMVSTAANAEMAMAKAPHTHLLRISLLN